MSCGVGRRCGLDLAWLWLWLGLVATAQIQPLAWEPPYAADAALTKKKKKKDSKSTFIKASQKSYWYKHVTEFVNYPF